MGEGVPSSRVNQRVWIYEALISGTAGCAAEYVAVPSDNAVELPDSISFEMGACLGIPALTVHRCVFADGRVTGKTVLVTGGADAVSGHAIQFAKTHRARVSTTVSRDEQTIVAKNAGADLVINRHKEDVTARIQQAAGVPGAPAVDKIIEVAFGENLASTMKLLKSNGVIATFASDARPEPTIPFWPLVFLDATIRFVLVYKMSREAHNSAIKATTVGLQKGWLQTIIALRFPLEQIAAAHEASESGKFIGKVVVLID